LKRLNFTTGKRRVQHGTKRFPRREPLRALQKILRPQQFLLPLRKIRLVSSAPPRNRPGFLESNLPNFGKGCPVGGVRSALNSIEQPRLEMSSKGFSEVERIAMELQHGPGCGTGLFNSLNLKKC
jgi:hypothetical protein